MTTALGLAAVTAVLKDLLNNGLIDHDAGTSVGAISVTSLPPDRIPVTAGQEQTLLNLFLYTVTPNAGWRNEGLPSMNGRGNPTSNPPLALDLHYLLSAYASDELHAEILLGYGMQLFHETPVLTRDAVRTALGPPLPVPDGGGLPPALQALTASELADQVELIKITPEPMSTEDMSKVWAALQAHYRPTTAYRASVVLIESRRSTRRPLPVRDRNVYVVPFRHPEIDRVVALAGEAEPIVAESNVVLEGRRLSAPLTLVNAGGIEVEPHQVTDDAIVARLPAGLRAGVQGVQVLQPQPMGTPPVAHRGVESNAAAFVLVPQVTASVANVVTSTVGGVSVRSADVTVDLTPAVGRSQRVVLLLNRLVAAGAGSAAAYSFVAPPRAPPDPPEAASLTVSVSGVVPDDYLVRVQVDGAESPLDTDAQGRFVGPQVTI
ncbi:MAG: DUF4255 domain-containing protein [Actinomycetota bacterium]